MLAPLVPRRFFSALACLLRLFSMFCTNLLSSRTLFSLNVVVPALSGGLNKFVPFHLLFPPPPLRASVSLRFFDKPLDSFFSKFRFFSENSSDCNLSVRFTTRLRPLDERPLVHARSETFLAPPFSRYPINSSLVTTKGAGSHFPTKWN